MRVLVVYHFYAHYREPVLRALVQSEEHDYKLISGDKPNHHGLEPLTEICLGNGRTEYLNYVKNCWFMGSLLWQSGLMKKIIREEYDAVIFLGNINFISTWVCAFFAKIKRKRILMWTHGVYGNEQKIVRSIRCLFYRLADDLMLYGNHAKAKLSQLAFDPGRLHVIYNSLDVSKQSVFYGKLKGSSKSEILDSLFDDLGLPLLIFVGRLTPQKKIGMLIDVVAAMENSLPVNLLIIGDGTERSTLEKSVRGYGISANVHFSGACFDDEVTAKFLYHADLCVAPGEIGLTAMHAMVYGTPVITHGDASQQMPEFEAIDPGVSGLFFEPDNKCSLANSIQKWLNQHKDRERVREACREIILLKYNPEVQRDLIDAAVGCRN